MSERYWLFKSEPLTYSIDDLAIDRCTDWEGVRNYQARNFMRDQMRVGDLGIFYHSNAHPPGAAGICRVSQPARPDHFAWDRTSPYFDPQSSPAHPRWCMVQIEFVAKLAKFVSLAEMRHDPHLQEMLLLKKGQRLSIQPLTPAQFQRICELGDTSLLISPV
jgi:predicted RNA-binding protein with PUA-like domain